MNEPCRSRRAAPASLTLFVTWLFIGGASAADEGVHDKAYWRAIIADDYTPPTDTALPALARELSAALGSTDAELRDEIAYSVLTQWLYVKRLMPRALRDELLAEWARNLQYGIGDRGTDSVLRRSFSALMLAVAVALDNETAYLDRKEYGALLGAAVEYLHTEQDTRGFDADEGWLHSVAHTADLLKFLGRSRHLERSEQAVILAGIASKVAELDHVLVHGEDERLARAVVSIVSRPDVDVQAFRAFLSSLSLSGGEGLPPVSDLTRNQNRKQLAVSLYAVLSTDSRDLDSLREARELVLEHLKTMM